MTVTIKGVAGCHLGGMFTMVQMRNYHLNANQMQTQYVHLQVAISFDRGAKDGNGRQDKKNSEIVRLTRRQGRNARPTKVGLASRHRWLGARLRHAQSQNKLRAFGDNAPMAPRSRAMAVARRATDRQPQQRMWTWEAS